MAPAAENLSAERIQSGLVAQNFGRTIHCLDQVDSTNLVARRRAEEGAAAGDVIFAEEQTQGRGRLGRAWFSPRHVNLYFSSILRPEFTAAHASYITLMAAVALAETLESVLPSPPEIKWPNDILVHGRKLAGILTESACEGTRIRFVILGVGINVNLPADLMPAAMREKATSLYLLTGQVFERNRLATLLLQGLDRCYKDLTTQGFAPMAVRWERYFRLKGTEVQVQMLDQVTRGTALGIDAEGALIIRDQDGVRQRVLAGDVSPLAS